MAITPSFTVAFDLDSGSSTFGQFILKDNTDYAGSGVSPSDIIGYFSISYPSGGYIGNFTNPDIDGSISLVNTSIKLPVDSFGNIQKGTYVFKYFVQVSGAVLPGTYISAPVTFDATKILCSIPEKVEISASTDCFIGILSAQNTTKYGLFNVQTREMTVYPPQSLSLPNYTVSASSLTYNFTHDNVSYQIGVNDLLTFTSGVITVTYRAKGMVLKAVNCDINLCRLRSCINAYIDKTKEMALSYGGFSKLPSSITASLSRMFALYVQFENSVSCNKFDDATTYYNEIAKIVSDAGCNCGCSDNDEPSVFTPISPSVNTLSLIEGTGIEIKTVVIGNTVSYEISISGGYQTTITTLVSDVNTLKGQVSTLQSQVTNLQNQTVNIRELRQVVYSAFGIKVPETGVLTTIANHTELAGALADGDELELVAEYINSPLLSTPVPRRANVIINGVEVGGLALNNSYSIQGETLTLKLLAKKETDTVIRYTAEYSWTLPKLISLSGTIIREVQSWRKTTGQIMVADLSANTLSIGSQAIETGTSLFTLNYATVKKYTV